MSNYYDELIQKIEKLIEENKLKEALILIEDELKMPYIPKIYEDKIINLYEKLNPNIDSKIKQTYFSKEEIIEMILDYEKYDVQFLIDLCSNLDVYNWNNNTDDLQNIFNFKNLDNKIKSIIYNTLATQGIDYNFNIKNQIINPSKNKTIFETDFSIKNLISLSKKNIENPGIIEVAQKIFFIYLMNQFPKSLFFEYKDISNEFINISEVMLGIKSNNDLTLEEQKIYKIIKNEI